MRSFLNPRTIAVIGGAEAARVAEQCRKLGFAGRLMAVHPARKKLAGLKCYARIADLPAAPDAAFIAIPAEATIAAVAELASLGGGGAVCYASGFGETGGAGVTRTARLIRAAGTMPLLGPNCYGFINLMNGAALWPDYHGAQRVKTGAAIFSQSGNVSLNLTMQRRFLPLALVVTVGNQAALGIEQCVAAALSDARITAIGLHLEGATDVALLAKLAGRARAQNIPIVALKSGRSAAGARIALSHTATLAGAPRLYDALFARLGIAQTTTPEEFIETLKLASLGNLPRGNKIASLSCSGGEASLVADLGARYDLQFPKLKPAHRRQVRATLNKFVRADNPLDYHTFIWDDEQKLTATYAAMLAGGFDCTLLILDTPADAKAMASWRKAARAFIAARRAAGGGAAAVISLLSESMPRAIAAELMRNGIAPLQGLAQGLAAVAAVCGIGRAWKRNESPPALARRRGVRAREASAAMDEYSAKKLLARYGFAIPKSRAVCEAKSAAAAAEEIGYPVAVKALSAEILHKTERGAVAVNLQNAAAVRAAAAHMRKLAPRILVEKMVADAVAETLLSLGYDAQFGHFIAFGSGGALVELIGDRAVLLPPFDKAMFRRALKSLRMYTLLRGYRGRPAADADALYSSAQKLLALAAREPDIIEVEINPLMLRAQSHGAVAADALITRATT